MLNIINNLKPFFLDCYRRISVREYSKLIDVSPPTASKILFNYFKKGLLLKEESRNYIYYYVNIDSKDFIDLSRIYWREQLLPLVEYLNKNLLTSSIILFGSLSKAENKRDSDVDLCIIAHKKDIELKIFEKALGKRYSIIFF